MTNTISRFLATPSPVFELQTEKLTESVSVQQYAIIRLAQCIQVRTSNYRHRVFITYVFSIDKT